MHGTPSVTAAWDDDNIGVSHKMELRCTILQKCDRRVKNYITRKCYSSCLGFACLSPLQAIGTRAVSQYDGVAIKSLR